ncbi:MAG: S8 family serine peptidase [Candidatus Heimdallarchaeota archaeon]
MKINDQIIQKRFLVLGLITLIIPIGFWENYTHLLNNEYDLKSDLTIPNLANLLLITPLSAEFIEKKHIEFYQSNFTTDSNKDTVDAVVVFNEDITWNFPDLVIDYEYNNLNGFKANIPVAMYNHLKQASFTKYAFEETKFVFSPNSNDDLHWGVDHTEAEEVWGGAEDAKDILPGQPTGAGVKVAVMDTGIDYTHSDLNNNYKGGYDFAGDYYTSDPDNDPKDDWLDEENEKGGHGTHVAGIIAAEDNGQDVIGVVPEASLYSLKVTYVYESTYYGNDYRYRNLDVALDWAIKQEMDVVSMAFGGDLDYFEEHQSAFLDLLEVAYDAGIILVSGAGNEGGWDFNHCPSIHPDVIQVGAVDKDNEITADSNSGPSQELVAPGGDNLRKIKSTKIGGGTTKKYGTSMACAMVSGVCALLLSAYPHLTPNEVRYILKETAVDYGDSGWDIYYGYGLVNAKAALDFAATYYQQPVFYEDGDGMTNSWQASDSPNNVIKPNHYFSGCCSMKNYEATSHMGYKMWAESPPIDLASWTGANDFLLTFRFRCKSSYSSSSVTQFRIRFYDNQTSSDVDFANPTAYSYYIVNQNNRNGQTWISGYDSGWQTVSFTLLASEFSLFAGSSNRLVLRWGHHDSWESNWAQTEYLDYLQIIEDDNAVVPDPPRELTGLGDGLSHITLIWKSPANVLASQYRIKRKVDGVYIVQATVNHDGFIDTTQLWMDPDQLTPGITYYYRVYAINNGIVGPYASWSGDVGW